LDPYVAYLFVELIVRYLSEYYTAPGRMYNIGIGTYITLILTGGHARLDIIRHFFKPELFLES